MTPRHLTLPTLTLLCAFLTTLLCPAQDQLDASEVFLQAFLLLKRSHKAEAAKDYATAVQKCQEASDMYDSIRRKWPRWRPDLLDFRRNKVREDLQRLQTRAAELGVTSDPSDPLSLPQRSSTNPSRINTSQGRPNSIARTPRAATPQARFELLEKEAARLRNEREQLLRNSSEQQRRNREANEALATAEQQVERLQRTLTQTQQELARLNKSDAAALTKQVDELKQQLAIATEGLREANERTKAVLAEFQAAQETIATMEKEREELIAQRDEMKAIINGLQTDGSTGQLVTENIRLREQLNATQAKLDDMRLQEVENNAEIAALRQEVTDLRLQLAQVQAENEGYKARLLELQGTLDGTDQELTFNPPSIGNEAARAENELLRNIIVKQLKQQTHRKKMRELIMGELQDVETGSESLMAQIDELAAEVPLNETEQAVVNSSGPPLTDVAAAGQAASYPILDNEPIEKKIARYAEAAAFNFEQGRYENAQGHYHEILRFAPDHVETLCNLGVIKIRLNQLEEAKGEFEKAIAAEASHSRSQFMLGVTLYHLTQLDESVAALNKSIELDPKNADYHHFLGVVHLERADWSAAETALQSALELRPRFPDAHYNLAALKLRLTPPDIAAAQRHYLSAKKQGLTPNEHMERRFRNAEAPSKASFEEQPPAS